MPGAWDAETYRARARHWRGKANELPPGKDYDACMALAEGYDNLAMLIAEENGGKVGTVVGERASADGLG